MPHRVGRQTGRSTLVLLALITFIVALLAMLVPAGYLGVAPGLDSALIGAAVLTLVLVPLVYVLVLRGKTGAQATDSAAQPEQTITDPLTRTLNRRGITIALLDLMALADRYGHRLSIAMLDVDHLRQVNESHGKRAGDAVVATLAAILTDTLRMPDRVGRYTDNEFLLVLPETVLNSACSLGERLRERCAEAPIDAGSETLRTTISLGVTEFRAGEDLESLITRAESALHQAKAKGRNCVVCTEAA
jgi:diguanylate cyclase (GGDEF)-like protein